MQGDFTLSELSIGWLESYWTVYWLSWMLLNCHRLWAELYAGVILLLLNCLLVGLTLVEPNDMIAAELSSWWLFYWWIHYYTVYRVTVLLECLDCGFSVCGCHLFYNLLIFNPILLSFGRGYFLCLVHIYSNFQLTPHCSLCDIDRNSWFLNYAISIAQFLPRLGWASYLCCLLLHQLLTTKRHCCDI